MAYKELVFFQEVTLVCHVVVFIAFGYTELWYSGFHKTSSMSGG